ncbi:MAG: ketopantoate reductase family protein [Myxococcales bacterium]
MRALVVGAGAVGQVFARHLALAGAEVTFLVKQRHAAELEGGLTLYPLNRRDRRAPLSFPRLRPPAGGYGVLTSPAHAADSRWDQVYLGVSSTGLRAGSWLEELAAATGEATIVALQPGLSDGAFIEARVAPARTVFGVTSFLSYAAPLPGERGYARPGLAYWFPPLGRSPFSGAPARAAAVVGALRAGGLPCRLVADARRLSIVPSAVFTGYIAALEAAGWTFDGLRSGRWLALASAVAREAAAIGARAASRAPPLLARLLMRPLVARAVLRLAPALVPFPLEGYARAHFTKVGDQTPLAFAEYVASGRKLGLPTAALEELAALVAARR